MKLHFVNTEQKLETASTDSVEIVGSDTLKSIVEEQAQAVLRMFSGEAEETPQMKTCSRCKRLGRVGLYPIEEFSTLKGKPRSHCKACRVEDAKSWNEKRKEHRREYQRAYREKNRETLKAYADSYRKRDRRPKKSVRSDILVVMGKNEG